LEHLEKEEQKSFSTEKSASTSGGAVDQGRDCFEKGGLWACVTPVVL